MQIRPSSDADFELILQIVNDGAQKYHGVIPADRWHEPYMSEAELANEMAAGVRFWVAEQEGRVTGVMGIQDKGDVVLVRHAYVATSTQRNGVGTSLLHHLEAKTQKPILIGTWAAATWAISFYERNGFSVVSDEQKNRLLQRYWTIPARQVETSVVLADQKWIATPTD
jgi:N-acetylglutamate synthase-like GNAT family acetyltransferase